MTATLEDQISAYVDAQLDDAHPVTADEVVHAPRLVHVAGPPSRRTIALRLATVLALTGTVGVLVLTHSGSHGVSPAPATTVRPSTGSTAPPAGTGLVCGVIGPSGSTTQVQQQPPHTCPVDAGGQGVITEQSAVTITGGGSTYVVAIVGGHWSARLPAGAYDARAYGCAQPGTQFTVTAGATLRGVVVAGPC